LLLEKLKKRRTKKAHSRSRGKKKKVRGKGKIKKKPMSRLFRGVERGKKKQVLHWGAIKKKRSKVLGAEGGKTYCTGSALHYVEKPKNQGWSLKAIILRFPTSAKERHWPMGNAEKGKLNYLVVLRGVLSEEVLSSAKGNRWNNYLRRGERLEGSWEKKKGGGR